MISKSMAVELAPDRIRVNAICPVIGETGLTAEFMGGDSPELRARFVASIPLGRMSQPGDIAAACVFLASTGRVLHRRRPRGRRRPLRVKVERHGGDDDARGADGRLRRPEVLRLGETPRPRPGAARC